MKMHRSLASTLLHRTNNNSTTLPRHGVALLTELFGACRLAAFVSTAIDNIAEKITVKDAMERLGLKTYFLSELHVYDGF